MCFESLRIAVNDPEYAAPLPGYAIRTPALADPAGPKWLKRRARACVAVAAMKRSAIEGRLLQVTNPEYAALLPGYGRNISSRSFRNSRPLSVGFTFTWSRAISPFASA